MEYGLIGDKLKHSFSKEIHAKIGNYLYELCEVSAADLPHFLQKRNFKAINVTMPYKKVVIPHLDYLSQEAQKIGAVNLIVNKNGLLYGYNTDYYGAKKLIQYNNLCVEGKKALILGSGGTAQTLFAVLSDLGANSIHIVSRSERPHTITYEEAYKDHADSEIIVNTTPVGMFPFIDKSPINLERFTHLKCVLDVIYNPITTTLIATAKEKNIPCANGLFMLTAQALESYSIVANKPIDNALFEQLYISILRDKQNIVLIGMPSSGKSTIGTLLAKKTGRTFIDTDLMTEKRTGRTAAQIIRAQGEKVFRLEESISVQEAATQTSCIIATGGGVIYNNENIRLLKKNGKLFFIDRPYSLLKPDDNHPLSSSPAAMQALYKKRIPVYLSAADEHIMNDKDIESVTRDILRKL